jgi:hypothetical protein
MKGRLVVLACAAMSLFFVTAAAGSDDLLELQSAVDALHQVDPAIDPPPSSGGDYVVGGADVSFLFAGSTAITAHSSPLGDDPRGIWIGAMPATQPPTSTVGQVKCLAVAANLAAVGIEVTRSDAFEQGSELVILVRDSGLAGGVGDGIDIFPGEVPADSCPAHVADAAAASSINHGNFVVHDEPL